LTIAVANDVQWQALCAFDPTQSWALDVRLAKSAGRLAGRPELDAALSRWTAQQARDALVARLRQAGIASSPVLSVEEMWCDPHFTARKMRTKVTIPVYGDEELFRAPWQFSGFQPRIERSGPGTGEHNDYVFGEILGMSAQEIAELKVAGVIA
jgi:crotonobetainyl-CoA:carnitine CoA-transferase CaiB-like acyl-CoA transferase